MMQPQHRRHLALGFLGATFAPAIALLAYASAASAFWPASLDDWVGVVVLFATTAVFSAIGVLSYGLPLVAWLRARKRLGWLPVLCCSAFAGAVYFAILGWLFSWDHHLPVRQLGPGALLGLASGVGFCLGAGPNNSFKPKPLRGSA